MRYVIVIVGLIVMLGALAGVKAGQISTLIAFGEQMQKSGPPPEVVNSGRIQEQSWEGTLKAIGSVVSSQGVALSNDVAGLVTGLHFDSGATAKKGQVLLELDRKVERAQLAAVRSRLALAETSRKRSLALAASGAIAQAQLDVDEASYETLSAEARALEAQIERKVLRAPFSGRLGIREVNLGQYLAPGTRVTMLESTDASYVDFSLPQQVLSKVKPGLRVRVRQTSDREPLAEGTILTVDPTIDSQTRSVKVRASFPKSKGELVPGMFLNAEVILPEMRSVVAVPLTAIVHAAYGDSLFVVEPRKDASTDGAPGSEKPPLVAHQHFVKLGETRGDFVEVISGIKPGQEVVTGGAFKLKNGVPVRLDNTVELKPSLDPHPANR